jgi:predicted SnoaL-like aldol condensation-catalyzing enzyme
MSDSNTMAQIQAEVEKAYQSLQDQPPHSSSEVRLIKKIIEFFLTIFKYHNYDRLPDFVGQDYKQHNPVVSQRNRDSIIEMARWMRKTSFEEHGQNGQEPIPEFRFKHIFVVGDFAIVHLHLVRWPGDPGVAVMDLFRHREDLLVEHWDGVMEVPPGKESMMF